MNSSSGKDRYFMKRAIGLAKLAKGKTFPNPLVGAVIVKNGKIVGEGYHKKAGTPHAEVIALRKAKDNTEGATLYVNLEPCSHYGKTPPCVKSIMKKGIKEVRAAMKDPNPMVNGMGTKILRKNRIKTKIGICRKEAEKLNKEYIEYIRQRRG